jgi:tetratricopeptide (TPR) repeat protein
MPKRKVKKKDFEILFYESLLQKKPNFTQVLSCLGDAYTRKGFYQESLEVDKKLVVLRPDDPIAHYNLSCTLSLLGDAERALEELKRAILLGYDDFSYILKDPDLENIRKHPTFQKFYQKLNQLKAL